jgi:hypothetical protein
VRYGELKYPKWQAEFQDAIIEFDREKLFEKVQKFETAIFIRLQQLASSKDHHAERQAIDDALSTIRVLKKERLSHPDWK